MVRTETPPQPLSHVESLPPEWGLNRKVTIRGKVTGDRFDINLQVGSLGPAGIEDTPLHISFRPGCYEIVCNAFEVTDADVGWGPEERQLGCATETGTNFQVEITVKPRAYGIFINGNHHCDFTHRLPYESARYIGVVGEARLDQIVFEVMETEY